MQPQIRPTAVVHLPPASSPHDRPAVASYVAASGPRPLRYTYRPWHHSRHRQLHPRDHFFSDDLVRVRYRPYALENVPEPVPYAIAKPLDEWSLPETTLVQTDKAVLIRTAALTVGIALDDAQLFIADADGNLLHADVDTGWHANGALRHRTALTDDARIFGLGERATQNNRRGRTHILWNTDPAGYTNGDDPINLNIPVYIVTSGTQEAGSRKQETRMTHPASSLIFYENPYYAEFDLGNTTTNVADHRFAGGELRYYVAAGTPVTPRRTLHRTHRTARTAAAVDARLPAIALVLLPGEPRPQTGARFP